MCNSIFGQWNVSSITDSHLLNTGILVRRYASDIKFINDKVVVSENLVITILDKDILSGFRFFEILNDSLLNESIDSKIFDSEGKKIKNAKVDLFHEKNNGSLLKLVSSKDLSFPLTIELEYKKVSIRIRGILNWNPVKDYNVSVQNASLRLTVIDTSAISYQSNKIPLNSSYVNEDGLFVFIWELADFKAIKKGNPDELPLNELPSVKIMSKQ